MMWKWVFLSIVFIQIHGCSSANTTLEHKVITVRERVCNVGIYNLPVVVTTNGDVLDLDMSNKADNGQENMKLCLQLEVGKTYSVNIKNKEIVNYAQMPYAQTSSKGNKQ